MRLIAFFFSMRRCSLFETNQRLRRTVLRTPLLTTFLRKRLSRESWDSPFRKFTDAKTSHLLSAWNLPRNENRPIRRFGRGGSLSNKKRQNDHWIKRYASHSSFVNSGHSQSVPITELHYHYTRFTRGCKDSRVSV